MKAEELRIGNFVKSGTMHTGIGAKKGYYVISAIGETVAWLNESNVGEYYKNIQSIPLTEQWMKKFGFKKRNEFCGCGINDNIEVWKLDGYGFIKDISDKWFLEGYDWNTKHFRYVHELQNLFFALSGEELKIKK